MQILKQNPIVILIFAIFAISAMLQWISTPVALLAGILTSQIFGNPFAEIQAKLVKIFLQTAIVGLGLGMNFNSIVEVGKNGFFLSVFSISITFIAGYFMAKLFGLEKKLTHLISSGTAICGGSAIAAISPIIKANQNQMSMALGIVFLLNSIALLIFPPLGKILNLSQDQFGLWSAIAIHDTSSVVGAAMEYGERALEVATTVKLSRALWIIPVSFLSMFMFKGDQNKVKIPMFIILFLIAIAFNSFLNIPSEIGNFVNYTSRSLLIFSIFMVGANLNFKQIRSAGIKPLFFGVGLWFIISISSLWVILFWN